LCGYTSDKEQVAKLLEIEKIYTVDYTNVGGSHTDVYLEEFPSESFNSVNFVDVKEPLEANLRVLLLGCHDSTLVEIGATPEQIEFLTELSEKINETSTLSCMPKLHIKIIEE